jgi:hypothetical protein
MTSHNAKRFAHRAACQLRDVFAHRSGISATESLVRRETPPTRFANVVLREAWVRRQTERRISLRMRISL